MNSAELVETYDRMLTMRRFEEAVGAGVVDGSIHGEMHLGIGQESVAAALAAQLRPGDAVVSTHRAHLHALACGVDPVELLAELYERDGLNGGKGGHMHLFDAGHRFMCTGIVGASAPIATGYALTQKVRHEPGVTVAVAGDGAMNQGAVLESLNLAAALRLPIVFLVEDNGYSISVARDRATGGTLADRASAFGIPGDACDGRDAERVHDLLGWAFRTVRETRAPVAALVRVYRFRGHYEGDPDLYRSPAEKEEAMSPAEDPLLRLRERLRGAGTSEQDLLELERAAGDRVAGWLAAARERPLPDPRTAREDVYADV